MMIEAIYNDLDQVLVDNILSTVGNLMSTLRPAIAAALGVYVIFWGVGMMRGVIQEPLGDTVGRMLRVTIAVFLAMNLGVYSDYILQFFWNSPEALASGIVGGAPDQGVVGALDHAYERGMELGDHWYDSATWRSPGPILVAVLLYSLVFLVIVASALVIMFSKVSLALLLAIGPLAFLMVLTPSTQRWFEGWLSETLNAAMRLVLTVLVLNVFVVMAANAAAYAQAGEPSVKALGEFVLLSSLLLVAASRVPAITSVLVGGTMLGGTGAIPALAHGISRLFGKPDGSGQAAHGSGLPGSSSPAQLTGGARPPSLPPATLIRPISYTPTRPLPPPGGGSSGAPVQPSPRPPTIQRLRKLEKAEPPPRPLPPPPRQLPPPR